MTTVLLEYIKAVKRGRREVLTNPRAKRVRFDHSGRRIVVELENETIFAFPCALAQGLADANDKDLERIVISPAGTGLRWPTLDVDFSLPGLMNGVFGTELWMKGLRTAKDRRRRSLGKSRDSA